MTGVGSGGSSASILGGLVFSGFSHSAGVCDTSLVIAVIYATGVRPVRSVHPIVHYPQTFADWADRLPGFENEMQGVTPGIRTDGQRYHGVYCVTETTS